MAKKKAKPKKNARRAGTSKGGKSRERTPGGASKPKSFDAMFESSCKTRDISEASYSSADANIDVSGYVRTGSFPLDLIMYGGFPRGRISEVYGDESVGKSTLCEHAIANTQRMGGRVLLLQADHGLDKVHARRAGVDLAGLQPRTPKTLEDMYGIVESFLDAEIAFPQGPGPIIVVDSLGALSTANEYDGDRYGGGMGERARTVSESCRRLPYRIGRAKAAVIIVNEPYQIIGSRVSGMQTTGGGKALRLRESIRLHMRKLDTIDGPGGDVDGILTQVRITKSKVCPPWRRLTVPIYSDRGIDPYLSYYYGFCPAWPNAKPRSSIFGKKAGSSWHYVQGADGKKKSFHLRDFHHYFVDDGFETHLQDQLIRTYPDYPKFLRDRREILGSLPDETLAAWCADTDYGGEQDA